MKDLFEKIPKEARAIVAALCIGIFFTSGMNERMIKAMRGEDLNRSPSNLPEMSTRAYVDTRIADLDKLSAQRYQEEVNALNEMRNQVAAQNLILQTLSNRFMDFALRFKQVSLTPYFRSAGAL